MDEQGLQNLLALGFSYEDLYKKGLLVLKSAGGDQSADASTQSADADQSAGEDKDAAAATQTTDADQSAGGEQSVADALKNIKDQFDQFKIDITKMIQGLNRENATRDNKQDHGMTVSAAIEGLYKGGK